MAARTSATLRQAAAWSIATGGPIDRLAGHLDVRSAAVAESAGRAVRHPDAAMPPLDHLGGLVVGLVVFVVRAVRRVGHAADCTTQTFKVHVIGSIGRDDRNDCTGQDDRNGCNGCDDQQATERASTVILVKLLTTGELAKELGVSRGAVNKWASDGLIVPEITTPGGHHRWNVDHVRDQLRELRKRDE